MNTRIEDTFSSLSKSMGSLARGWPRSWPVIARASQRTSPYTYAAIAGAGVATGVGLGLFLAPQSGKQLRGDVLQRARALRDTVGAKLDKATRAVSETAGSITAGKGEKAERPEKSEADDGMPNRVRPQGTVRA